MNSKNKVYNIILKVKFERKTKSECTCAIVNDFEAYHLKSLIIGFSNHASINMPQIKGQRFHKLTICFG